MSKELYRFPLRLLTSTEVKADFMHPIDMYDDEVVACCWNRSNAMFLCRVTELYPKAEPF
jgi:hypothetical protein